MVDCGFGIGLWYESLWLDGQGGFQPYTQIVLWHIVIHFVQSFSQLHSFLFMALCALVVMCLYCEIYYDIECCFVWLYLWFVGGGAPSLWKHGK